MLQNSISYFLSTASSLVSLFAWTRQLKISDIDSKFKWASCSLDVAFPGMIMFTAHCFPNSQTLPSTLRKLGALCSFNNRLSCPPFSLYKRMSRIICTALFYFLTAVKFIFFFTSTRLDCRFRRTGIVSRRRHHRWQHSPPAEHTPTCPTDSRAWCTTASRTLSQYPATAAPSHLRVLAATS